ncbi:MAG: helix-turn-helix transcriptional regulator [Lachnospiraceae bacterium]|nr:helix-turn-helix transcriptional regulator [Lachnospiraceae bacterium]
MKIEKNNRDIASSRINALCIEKEITSLKQLAEMSGCSPNALGKVKNGQNNLGLNMAKKLSSVLDASPQYLMGDSDFKNPEIEKIKKDEMKALQLKMQLASQDSHFTAEQEEESFYNNRMAHMRELLAALNFYIYEYYDINGTRYKQLNDLTLINETDENDDTVYFISDIESKLKDINTSEPTHFIEFSYHGKFSKMPFSNFKKELLDGCEIIELFFKQKI